MEFMLLWNPKVRYVFTEASHQEIRKNRYAFSILRILERNNLSKKLSNNRYSLGGTCFRTRYLNLSFKEVLLDSYEYLMCNSKVEILLCVHLSLVQTSSVSFDRSGFDPLLECSSC
jgi:hypothetical protein